MLEKIRTMNMRLPKEIETCKAAGDLKRAERIADRYLADERTPQCMKDRLLLEKEILRRIPSEYLYTEEEGLALVRKEIPDFTMEELRGWEDSGAADFRILNGEVRLQNLFFDSMKKVYPEVAKRAGILPAAGNILDDNMKYMKEHGSARWHIHLRHTVRIRDDVFRPGKVLVHLPLPSPCMNMENVRIISADPEAIIDAENAGMRTAAFRADLRENRTFTVEYEYDSFVRYTDPDPSGAYVSQREDTEEIEPQIVFTPLIRSLCQELSGTETNPVVLARRFYDYVTKNCTYSFVPEYLLLGNIPEYIASGRKGDCGVQALLFITLCRCAGIPAKWQSGLYVSEEHVGNHDWALFHTEPYGWLFADCSFGGAAYRAGNKERHDFYFGNLDPFRMAANNAFQQEFCVPKKQWRIDPYDNQSGEIEYEDRGLLRDEIISEKTLVGMYQIED